MRRQHVVVPNRRARNPGDQTAVKWNDDSITFAEMLSMFHGADERVSEASIVATAEFLASVIQRFSTRTTS